MSYPRLEIDWLRYRQLAENVWNAQCAGWPTVLTYSGPDVSVRRATRRRALHFEHDGVVREVPRVLSRDEYPFACTDEGGRGWVGHIPAEQNSAQGGLIAAFLQKHGIVAGRGERSKFVVAVINHPRGAVVRAPRTRRGGADR